MIRNDPNLAKQVRQIYEPRYGRRLSDEEVTEIRRNLDAFAAGLLAAAKELHSRAKAASSTKREHPIQRLPTTIFSLPH